MFWNEAFLRVIRYLFNFRRWDKEQVVLHEKICNWIQSLSKLFMYYSITDCMMQFVKFHVEISDMGEQKYCLRHSSAIKWLIFYHVITSSEGFNYYLNSTFVRTVHWPPIFASLNPVLILIWVLMLKMNINIAYQIRVDTQKQLMIELKTDKELLDFSYFIQFSLFTVHFFVQLIPASFSVS